MIILKKVISICLLTVILISIVPVLGEDANWDKMDAKVRERVQNGDSSIDVIIEFYELSEPLANFISKDKISKEFTRLNSVHAKLSADEIKQLSLIENVKGIWTNAPGLKLFESITYSEGENSVINGYLGADTIKASSVYPMGIKGDGIVVAVIDTGIRDTHIEFPEGKILYQYNFIDGNEDATDTDGHGTHVAGTIAGSYATTLDWANGGADITATSSNTTGIAPNANLIILKAVPGDLSVFLDTCDWIIANKNTYNIRIVNMSAGWNKESIIALGWPLDGTDPASNAAGSVVDAGIVWVNAAGNKGPDMDTIGSPARSRKVITVGNAVDRTVDSDPLTFKPIDSPFISGDSSRGGGPSGFKPDVVAPGTNILSAWDTGDGHYYILSGTSMAAPHVSGVCALILQRNPHWTPYQVKTALMRTANPLPNAGRYDQGAGMVNAQRAVFFRQQSEKLPVAQIIRIVGITGLIRE